MDFDVVVDGFTHQVSGDHVPSEEEASAIRDALRAQDVYTQHEQANGLPPGTLRAIAAQESTFNPDAVSPTGARGLMQFTRTTGAAYGLTEDRFTDPVAQVAAAGRFMGDNLKATKGDLRAAIARYGDPKEKDYADKVLARFAGGGPAAGTGASAPPPAAPPGGGTAAPSSAPDTAAAVEPPGLLARGWHALANSAKFRLASVAADYNALKYHWGMGWHPQDFKAWMQSLGVPDAEQLPDQEPQTALQQATAYLRPWVVPTTMFGAGVLTDAATGNHKAGDVAEALTGGVQAFRQGLGLVGAGRQIARDVKTARAGGLSWGEVWNGLTTARHDAFKAQLQEGVAAATTREALASSLAVRPSQLETPEAEFARVAGLTPEAPGPIEAGGDLRVTGAGALRRVPGERAGAGAMSAKVGQQTTRLFQRAEALADTKQLAYEPASGPLLAVQSETQQLVEGLGGEGVQRIGGRLTADEKALLADLRGAGGTLDPKTGELTLPTGHGGGLVDLMQLYKRVRMAALNPEQFPTLTSQARNRFYTISNLLGDAVRTEVQQDEDVAKAWFTATEHTRTVREPVRATMTHLRGGGTALEALGRSYGDPEHLFNTMRIAGPRWSLRLRQGIFGDILRIANGNGQQMLQHWERLPMETRQMLAAQTTPRSAQALAQVLRDAHPIRTRDFDFGRALRGASDDLKPGVDAVTNALKAFATKSYTLRSAQSGFARYHAVRGAFAALMGQPQSAIYQLGAYTIMAKPQLLRSLVSVAPQSVRFGQLAAALDAILTPLLHGEHGPALPTAPVSPLPPARPAPAAPGGQPPAQVAQAHP